MVFSNQQSVIGATVFFDADIASTRKVYEASRTVRKAIEDVQRTQSQNVKTPAQAAIEDLAADFIDAARNGEAFDKVIRRVTEDLTKLGATQDDIRDLSNEIGRLAAKPISQGGLLPDPSALQARGSTLRQFGYQLFNLPDFGPTTEISRASILAGGALERFNGSMKDLLMIAGPSALALGGLIVVIKLLLDTAEAGKRQVEGALAAQDAYYNSISEGKTSEEVREDLAALESRREALRQQINETRNAANVAFAQTQQAAGNVMSSVVGALIPGAGAAGAGLGDAVARVLGAAGISPVSQLNDRLAELETESAEVDGTITRLNQGLEDSVYAVNDAIEAERRRNEELARTNNLIIGTLTSGLTMDVSDINDRANAINYEKQVLQQYIDERRVSAEQQEEFNQRIRELNIELATLLNDVTPGAVARTRTELDAEITETFALRDSRVKAIRDEETRMIGEIERDRGSKLGDLERASSDDRLEAIRDAQQDESEAYKDHLKNLAKIYRDASRAIEDAILARDASALYKAQQKRADAISDEEASYEDRRDKINQRLSETTRDIDRKLVEQRRVINQRYDEQLRVQRAQADRQVKLEYDKANATAAATTAIYNAHINMLNGILAAAARTSAQVNASLAAAAPSVNYPNPIGPQTYYDLGDLVYPRGNGSAFNFASGGKPPLGMWSRINEAGIESAITNKGQFALFNTPTRIFSAEQTRALFSGRGDVNANFNLYGPTEKQFKRQFDRSYKKLLKMSRDNYGQL